MLFAVFGWIALAGASAGRFSFTGSFQKHRRIVPRVSSASCWALLSLDFCLWLLTVFNTLPTS